MLTPESEVVEKQDSHIIKTFIKTSMQVNDWKWSCVIFNQKKIQSLVMLTIW